MRNVEIWGIETIPEVREGDSLVALIEEGIRSSGRDLQDDDILVVSQKIVSKAEGETYRPEDLSPTPAAQALAEGRSNAPEHVELILRETARMVRMDLERGILIAETQHGYVCANAGVDRSNVGEGGTYTALPRDPDASARRLRRGLQEGLSVRIGVIISDSFGRPWRKGSTDVAIGVAGLSPLQDYRGQHDRHGYKLHSTVVALADEVASAAELAKGKLEEVPIAVVRGVAFRHAEGSIQDAIRPTEEDLFR
ncbi:MAG: coenzyme F420-0:L-glutamate ligase [Thermoplasmata archaeon]